MVNLSELSDAINSAASDAASAVSQVETSVAPAKAEASEDELKLRTPWELTAQCTRFILEWSERVHRVKVESIFDVIRQELARREGLRAYGIRVPADKAQSLTLHAPKLLSKSEAA